MLPEGLSALPLGEGLRTDGASGGLPCLGGGLWGPVVPVTAGKFPELQVRRVPVLRSYFRLGRDRAGRHFLGLLGLCQSAPLFGTGGVWALGIGLGSEQGCETWWTSEG